MKGVEIQVNSKTPEELFKVWMNSYEEETGNGVHIYRNTSFDFPLSRGRTGFEILENGRFIEYAIGPDDRPLQHEGKWIYCAKTKIIDITFNKIDLNTKGHHKETNPPYSLEIVSLDKDKLEVKRLKTITAQAEEPKN